MVVGEVEWAWLPEQLCYCLVYRSSFQKILIKKERVFCCFKKKSLKIIVISGGEQ